MNVAPSVVICHGQRMDKASLNAILETAEATEKDGFSQVPDGRTLTLYAAHGGVSLSVPKTTAVKAVGPLLVAKTIRGETYLLELGDLFAASIEGGQPSQTRKAGFI